MSTNQTTEELEAQGLEKLRILVNDVFNRDEAGWTYKKEIDDVKIYTKHVEGMTMNAWMGQGIVDADPKELWEDIGVNGTQTRKHWDKMLDQAKNITNPVESRLQIGHTVFTAPWPVWWRDFCACQYTRELDEEFGHPGCFADLQWSITRDDVPELPNKYVRGKNIGGGFVFEPFEGKTKLSYVVVVDPMGSLPQFVVDMVSIDQPMIVKAVREYWEKK